MQPCSSVTVAEACQLSQNEGQACYDDTLFPWKRAFACSIASRNGWFDVLTLGVLLTVATLLMVWVCVHLLSQVRPWHNLPQLVAVPCRCACARHLDVDVHALFRTMAGMHSRSACVRCI